MKLVCSPGRRREPCFWTRLRFLHAGGVGPEQPAAARPRALGPGAAQLQPAGPGRKCRQAARGRCREASGLSRQPGPRSAGFPVPSDVSCGVQPCAQLGPGEGPSRTRAFPPRSRRAPGSGVLPPRLPLKCESGARVRAEQASPSLPSSSSIHHHHHHTPVPPGTCGQLGRLQN